MSGNFDGNNFIGFSERLQEEIILEKSIIKPLLKGKDVRKYEGITNNFYVIYPHKFEENKTKPIDENELKSSFPLTFKYLSLFKNELVKKKIHKRTNPTFWYSLHRSRDIAIFEQLKMVTPETSLGGNLSLDYDKLYHNTQVYSLIKHLEFKEDYKFWLSILNSNLFWFFLKSTGAVLRGGYFRFKTKYLEPFPLPKLSNLEEQNPFIDKVDFMFSSTNSLNNCVNQFLKLLQSKFQIEKFSKKLQSWHQLEFSDFLKELKKQMIKLSLSDEAEWMQYFEDQKGIAVLIKSEIDQTDKEIDQMVYELYGLSDEEIAIVEAK